jgi:xanthine dehydrogenase accessory factor
VAHLLFSNGYSVIVHEEPQPTTTRRGMAFADAVFEGHVVLDCVPGRSTIGLLNS